MPYFGPDTTDSEIMAAIRRQEAAAMQQLYDRYFRRAFALAVRMLGDAALAEDCVHDSFLKVWQRPTMYDEQRGAFSSWFLTTVHNRASNMLRSRQHQAAPLPETNEDGEKREDQELVDESADVERQVWSREQQRIVHEALETLNQPQRQVLELAYFSGLTQAEIATHLDQPLGTVKTRIRTAMHKLRDALEAQNWQTR